MAIKEKKEQEKISILLEDLHYLESYARDLFSFLPLPVCFVSPIGVVLEINPAFEKFTGYSAVEIVGRIIEIILKKDVFETLAKEARKKGLIKTKEINVLTKEKKEIPIMVSIVLRKGEEKETTGYFISLFDLSDIRKTERELKNTQIALLNILEDTEEVRKKSEEERNKTLAVITNLTDGLLVFDSENKLSLINHQVEEFFNIKNKDVTGKSVEELRVFPFLRPIADLVGPEIKGVFRKELSIKEDLILEISTVPIMRENEKLGVLVILHNITREKLIEKMKSEFVSISAHQLRTPLSATKWALKMLLEGDVGGLTLEQQDFIKKTYQSNEKMIHLINDMLDVSRIEEGRYLYKPVLTDFIPIIQFVINSYKEEIKRKNIKLNFQKPEKELRIEVDVEKIKLAIQNLFDNAIKYTPPGGSVTISLKSDKKEIEFSIKDSGVGIPKDQQQRIFSRFFRGANVIRMETEGSGLGLFIAKNIIEAHGGKIWFTSNEGEGTTFYFSLPLKEEFAEFLKEF